MNTLIVLREISDDEVTKNAFYVANVLKKFGDVHIVSFGNDEDYDVDGVHVHKVNFILQADNVFNWVMLMNNELKRRAVELNDEKKFDIIHVHDWTAGPAGMSLAKLFGVPLISTFHSTEHQRGFGAYVSQAISDVEWWLAYESRYILVTNDATKNSLINDLKVPSDKIFYSNEDGIKKVFSMVGVMK